MLKTNSKTSISEIKVRYKKALKLIDAIEHFECKRKNLLYSANSYGTIFPNLKEKFLHEADICERASERLTKKLLSKNF
jgi:hypothetical protein